MYNDYARAFFGQWLSELGEVLVNVPKVLQHADLTSEILLLDTTCMVLVSVGIESGFCVLSLYLPLSIKIRGLLTPCADHPRGSYRVPANQQGPVQARATHAGPVDEPAGGHQCLAPAL